MCRWKMFTHLWSIEKSQTAELLFGFLLCWDTRTRTKNNRTRICCVTITPYPNMFASLSDLRLQSYYFFSEVQKLSELFFKFLFSAGMNSFLRLRCLPIASSLVLFCQSCIIFWKSVKLCSAIVLNSQNKTNLFCPSTHLQYLCTLIK